MNATGQTAQSPQESRALLGVAIILGVVAVRCLSPFDPFPYWSGDPFEAPAPVVGLTPSVSVAMDIVTALGAAITVSAMRAAELRRAAWGFAAAALGFFSVLRHTGDAAGLDNFVSGSVLVSGFVGAAAVFAVASRPPVRRMVLAVLLALLVMLAVRALQQVYVEHPRTLETFRATREQFFRAQGWTPDSPMAKAFERRLSQAEASGYFGMANVLATLGAAGVAMALSLRAATYARSSRVAKPTPSTLAVWAVIASAVVLVYYAGAKGGFAAAGLGVAAAFVGLMLVRRGASVRPRWARLLGSGVVLAALGAVVVRGMVGERIGELSILFRWFYMQASARIIGDHPLLGVGAAGFKGAYLLAKNPLSPEEVTSPHSVLLDVIASMGLMGVGLALLWMFWVSLGAAGLLARSTDTPAVPNVIAKAADPSEWKPTALIIAVATIGAIAMERNGLTPDGAVTRLIGVCLAVWVVVGVTRLLQVLQHEPAARDAVRIGLAAGVIACAAHSQIELTAITPGAAGWCLLLLALAAGWDGAEQSAAPLSPLVKRLAVSVAVLAIFAGAAWPHARRVLAWQASLASAYEGTEAVAEVSARRNALATGSMVPGFEADSPERMAHDLSRMSGTSVEATPESIDRAVAALRLAESARSLGAMPAHDPQLPHFPTLRARSRLALIQAEAHSGLGGLDRSRAALAAGRAELDSATSFRPFAAYWAWVGTYEEASAELEARVGDTARSETHTRASLAAWEQAFALGPHELLPARKALTAAAVLNDEAAIRRWAGECLRVNEYLRLDPLEQMSEREVTRCKSLAGKP
ncbi:MAG TPA: O-antigen ligase family protein [Phycisphaerales bacterium]|nr:O-antigen ligase family protein [Phycisphaerales bacterium]